MKGIQKFIVSIFIIFLVTNQLWADRLENIFSLIRNERYDTALDELNSWEAEPGENPDVYIGFYNLYVFKSRSSGIVLDTRSIEGESLAITDPETGEVVGFLGERTSYDPENAQIALNYIDRGINHFPDRLDIIFGKAVFLGQLKFYIPQANTIIQAVEHSQNINHQWYWSGNQALPDGKGGMLNAILDYAGGMIQEITQGEDPKKSAEALVALKMIGEIIKEHHPDVPYGYNFIAVQANLSGNQEKAIEEFYLAHEQFPNDEIIMLNLGSLLALNNRKSEAIEIYNNVVELNGRYSVHARNAIDRLR